MTPTEKAVAAMARALCEAQQPKGAWERNPDPNYRSIFCDEARVAITALISLYPGIASLIEGTHIAIPDPLKTQDRHNAVVDRAMLAAAEDKPHD